VEALAFILSVLSSTSSSFSPLCSTFSEEARISRSGVSLA
jgi:hypothetical protein